MLILVEPAMLIVSVLHREPRRPTFSSSLCFYPAVDYRHYDLEVMSQDSAVVCIRQYVIKHTKAL